MARKKKNLPLLLNVEIQDFAAEGKTVSRVRLREDDETPIVLFVPFAVPGDVADIQVVRKKNSYAEGVMTRLVAPSPLRVKPRCPHFGICGGCKWQDMEYAAQADFKQKQVEQVLKRIGRVELPEMEPIVAAQDCWEYRNKMEFTFSNKKWRTKEELESGEEFSDSSDALGFHIGGSFDKILQINHCYLQNEKGNEIRNYIDEYARTQQISYYDIRANEGILRNLIIRNTSTEEIMVIIVFGEEWEGKTEMLEDIAKRFPEITTLAYIINKKLNDSIADQTVHVFKGPGYITEKMGNLRYRIQPKSFYQTNSRQAQRLYDVARNFAGLDETLPEDEKPVVYDLYTGAGTIANYVAGNARKVIGIEYVEDAVADAKINAEINGINNTVFFAGDMKDVLTRDFIEKNGTPEIMIIDPPRAGMHPDVVKVILEAAPKVLVYVSCNPATQARDIEMLAAKYEVTAVKPVDMFPHTQHVENVCRLQLR